MLNVEELLLAALIMSSKQDSFDFDNQISETQF